MAMSRFLKVTGAVGLGLVVLGVYLSYRDKKQRGLAGHRYMAGRFAEAPIVDSYSDGETTTVLRASEDMPIEQRVASIQKMVEKSVQDPRMRALAIQITRSCPERDGMCAAKKIYKAVKKRVRYTGDISPVRMSSGVTEGIDLYQSARKTWEMGAGDCDDQTILIETLLSSIGITARSRVIAESANGEDSHIYPIALLPWFSPTYAVALDTTLPGSGNFGVEAPAGRITDFDA